VLSSPSPMAPKWSSPSRVRSAAPIGAPLTAPGHFGTAPARRKTALFGQGPNVALTGGNIVVHYKKRLSKDSHHNTSSPRIWPARKSRRSSQTPRATARPLAALRCKRRADGSRHARREPRISTRSTRRAFFPRIICGASTLTPFLWTFPVRMGPSTAPLHWKHSMAPLRWDPSPRFSVR